MGLLAAAGATRAAGTAAATTRAASARAATAGAATAGRAAGARPAGGATRAAARPAGLAARAAGLIAARAARRAGATGAAADAAAGCLRLVLADNAHRHRLLHHGLLVLLEDGKLLLDELANLLVLRQLHLPAEARHVLGVRLVHLGDVALLELLGGQRRHHLDFLLLDRRQPLGHLHPELLRDLLELLAGALVVLDQALGHLLDLLALRLLLRLLAELDLVLVVHRRAE